MRARPAAVAHAAGRRREAGPQGRHFSHQPRRRSPWLAPWSGRQERRRLVQRRAIRRRAARSAPDPRRRSSRLAPWPRRQARRRSSPGPLGAGRSGAGRPVRRHEPERGARISRFRKGRPSRRPIGVGLQGCELRSHPSAGWAVPRGAAPVAMTSQPAERATVDGSSVPVPPPRPLPPLPPGPPARPPDHSPA